MKYECFYDFINKERLLLLSCILTSVTWKLDFSEIIPHDLRPWVHLCYFVGMSFDI